jgi:hypothetical protein
MDSLTGSQETSGAGMTHASDLVSLTMHFDAFLQRACPPLDLDWRKYRRRAARHRVQQRMTDLGLSQFEDYLGVCRTFRPHHVKIAAL